MNITSGDIGNYLQILSETTAWRFHAIPDTMSPVYWLGETILDAPIKRHIEVYVGITQQCVTFQMPLVIHIYPGCIKAIQHFLLQLNREMKLVKVGIDDANEMHFLAELLMEACSLSAIVSYLDALTTYFSALYREMETLAHDVALARLWETHFMADGLELMHVESTN